MSELINPYSLSLISGLISVMISYIDNSRNKQNRKISDYLKLFILVSVIILLVIYIYDTQLGKQIFDNQDILTGNPDF